MRYWLRNASYRNPNCNTSEQVEKTLDIEDDKVSTADLQTYEDVQGEAGVGDDQGREEEQKDDGLNRG